MTRLPLMAAEIYLSRRVRRMELNRVDVVIGGKTYRLKTADNVEYVSELARQLDKRINRFMDDNANTAILTAAIMVGLDILDESLKVNSNIDNIRTQIKTYVEDAAKARLETDKVRAQLKEAQEEIKILSTELELKNLKEKI